DAATPANGITKNLSYDSLGNLISVKVAGTLQQVMNFSSLTQYAFPDSVTEGPTSGPQLTTSATYNLTTGQIATATDENSKMTTYTYSDPGHLDRLTDTQRPDGSHISNVYDDVQNTVTVKIPLQGTSVTQKVKA